MNDDKEYTYLGESGMVEDEEGNICSASEIYGKKTEKPIKINSLPSFISELDDKTNPAYWYNHYDRRYNGHSREEYMELMAHRERMKLAAAQNQQDIFETITEPQDLNNPPETPRERADREQKEAERAGLHTVFTRDSSGPHFRAVLDRNERVIISNKDYRFVGRFCNGLAVAVKRKTRKCGFVDPQGNERIPCTWRSVGAFSEYKAGVQNEQRRSGYVDVTGRLIIPCVWKEAWPFHNGLAVVQGDNNRLGFIDTLGSLVIPCRYLKAGFFNEDGIARVSDTRQFLFRYKWVYIDRQGRVVKEEE